MTEQLKRVCRAFRIEGEWASYEEISVGNICSSPATSG